MACSRVLRQPPSVVGLLLEPILINRLSILDLQSKIIIIILLINMQAQTVWTKQKSGEKHRSLFHVKYFSVTTRIAQQSSWVQG